MFTITKQGAYRFIMIAAFVTLHHTLRMCKDVALFPIYINKVQASRSGLPVYTSSGSMPIKSLI